MTLSNSERGATGDETTLRPSDVLFGKGKGILTHAGNVKLREIVRQYINRKGTVARHTQSIMNELVKKDIRFVELVPGTMIDQKRCRLVSDERGMAKIAYTITNEMTKLKHHESVEQTEYILKPRRSNVPVTPRDSLTPGSASERRRSGRKTSQEPTSIIESTTHKTRIKSISLDGMPRTFLSAMELGENDVVFSPSKKDKVHKRAANVEFVKSAAILSKVFPQVSLKENVKIRVAAKLRDAVYAMDPPGRFLAVADGTFKYALLSEPEINEWIFKTLETVHSHEKELGAPIQKRSPLSPASSGSTNSSSSALRFRNSIAAKGESPMNDQAAARIMLTLLGQENDWTLRMDKSAGDDDSADSLATQPPHQHWRTPLETAAPAYPSWSPISKTSFNIAGSTLKDTSIPKQY